MARIRNRRVGEAIRDLIAETLARRLSDPRLRMVTLTAVEVTPDLSLATIRWSILAGGEPERQAAAIGLESARGLLRHEISRALRLRVTPELRFLTDRTVEYAAHIDQVLGELRAAGALGSASGAGEDGGPDGDPADGEPPPAGRPTADDEA